MGLHASYYPIDQETLEGFVKAWDEEEFWLVFHTFEEESRESDLEFYIGTAWHVLDFVINSSKDSLLELKFAVRGHEFPAPDGSINPEPHLPSYKDNYWQTRTYLASDEIETISELLPLIDEQEFNARFVPEKMTDVYHAPLNRDERQEYFELFLKMKSFYKRVAMNRQAVLINIS